MRGTVQKKIEWEIWAVAMLILVYIMIILIWPF